MKKIAVLLSGRGGSNFISIYKSVEAGEIDGEIAVVISNKADAKGLDFAAEKGGLNTVFVNPKDYDGREAYDTELVRILKENGVELVCLAVYAYNFFCICGCVPQQNH